MPRVPGLGAEVGLHEQGEAVAVAAVGDPRLRAVDDVGVAVAAGGRADGLEVGAAVGLGERQPAAQLARRRAPGGRSRAASSVPNRADEVRHHQVRVEDAGERHPHLGDAWRRSRRRPPPTGRARRTRVGIVAPKRPNSRICSTIVGRVSVGVLELEDVRPHVAFEPAPQRPTELRQLLVRSGSGHVDGVILPVASDAGDLLIRHPSFGAPVIARSSRSDAKCRRSISRNRPVASTNT